MSLTNRKDRKEQPPGKSRKDPRICVVRELKCRDCLPHKHVTEEESESTE